MVEEYIYQGDRGLDLKIAIELMEWDPKSNPEYFWFTSTGIDFSDLAEKIWGVVGGYSGPEFTNDITAAFLAVSEMQKNYDIEFNLTSYNGWWTAYFDLLEDDAYNGGTKVISRWTDHARTPCIAICKAIEKYLDGEEE